MRHLTQCLTGLGEEGCYPSSRLTYSSVLQEVGSIIGKKGEIVKRFREEVSVCPLLA